MSTLRLDVPTVPLNFPALFLRASPSHDGHNNHDDNDNSNPTSLHPILHYENVLYLRARLRHAQVTCTWVSWQTSACSFSSMRYFTFANALG